MRRGRLFVEQDEVVVVVRMDLEIESARWTR